MSRPRTVFIIGAGASHDFGLPIGKTLQTEIAGILCPSNAYDDGLHPAIVFNLEEVRKRGKQFGKSLSDHCKWMSETIPLSPSIDTFLDKNAEPDDVTSYLGKLAIAHIIAGREAGGVLKYRPGNTPDWGALSKTWMGQIWALANVGGAAKKVENPLPEVAFVTFNYDRCIEQFLILAILQSYQITYGEAVQVAGNIPCEHVYGSLGLIGSGEGFSDYGSAPHPANAGALVNRVKTFTEQVDSETSDRICRLLADAGRIVFLGFSFGAINLRFLERARNPAGNLKSVVGTAFDMSEEDIFRAEEWANGCFRKANGGAKLQNLTAAKFFERNYMLFQRE